MTVGTHRVQKRAMDPQELEFQAAVICQIGVLGAQQASSAEDVCVLNC